MQQFGVESTDFRVRLPWAPILALSRAVSHRLFLHLVDILEHQLCIGVPKEAVPAKDHSKPSGAHSVPISQMIKLSL